MAKEDAKSLVVELQIHQPYDVRRIAEFFGDEDKARNRFVVDERFLDAHPEVVSDTAERDSEWAQKNGIPEGTDWILFIDRKNRKIWYVYRGVGSLGRLDCGLGDAFVDNVWVACPRK